MNPYRTHVCNELKTSNIDQEVLLSGWIHSVRDHGGVIFIDLRDNYGITQIVVNPDQPFYQEAAKLRMESVVNFKGFVTKRQSINPKLPTGEIEVIANKMIILGHTEVLPFQINEEEITSSESLRLKYRFLDLRRQYLHDNIILRSKIISHIRNNMINQGFNEFQTPILTSSSPEGARDFLVPSRLHPGSFYALPQAPQQFKQLLMTAGFDRYFQIAPCFRDEDARADRSPGEFYQLDLEMSFATQEDVFEVVENVMTDTFNEFTNAQVDSKPFVRIPYAQAMNDFGCDKPDLRNPLRLVDVTEQFKDSNFNVFKSIATSNGRIKAIRVQNCVDRPRKFFDELVSYSKDIGSKGLAYIGWRESEVRGSIAKFLSKTELNALKEYSKAGVGDVLFLIADTKNKVNEYASQLLV